jgi:hypothetical protein
VPKKNVEATVLHVAQNGNVSGSDDNPSCVDNRIDNRSPGTLSAYSAIVDFPLQDDVSQHQSYGLLTPMTSSELTARYGQYLYQGV